MAFKLKRDNSEYKEKESKWNIEDARHKSVDFFLKLCEANLMKWDLDAAYWALREVKIIVIPKFTEDETEEVNKSLNKLESKRQGWLKKKLSDGNFRLALEEFYELLNILMTEHNMYFREEKAILGL
ncbi:MAG: hypothetical protein ACTSPV_01230 [Candidatus Hodarchaeales archaeon]